MSASEKLKQLEGDVTPAGELGWWFDGRDVFHKPPGTNLDQVIVPLGQVLTDTYTDDGAVNPADVRLWVALRNALPQIVAVVEAAEAEVPNFEPTEYMDPDGTPLQRALAALDEVLA